MKYIINFLEYLYNKYYYLQIKMGNSDVAKYTSIMMITFFLNFYFIVFLIFLDILFNVDLPTIPKIIYLLVIFLTMILLYLILVYKNFDKIINSEEIKRKSNFFAILFPIIGFILFAGYCIFKMLQNQGRI
jgi:archaellum biogenesis protein FlaJ (TadC family)